MELAPKYRGEEINNQITADAVVLLRGRNALLTLQLTNRQSET